MPSLTKEEPEKMLGKCCYMFSIFLYPSLAIIYLLLSSLVSTVKTAESVSKV